MAAVVEVAAVLGPQVVERAAPLEARLVADLRAARWEARHALAPEHLARTVEATTAAAQLCLTALARGHRKDS